MDCKHEVRSRGNYRKGIQIDSSDGLQNDIQRLFFIHLFLDETAFLESSDRKHQERSRAAGGIQNPRLWVTVIAQLIQEAFGKPVWRIVLT